MSDPTVPTAYAEAFLSACMDAGMCKDAAFILLRKAYLTRRVDRSPAYKEGLEDFCKRAATEDAYPWLGAAGGAALAGTYFARKPLGQAGRWAGRQLLGGTSILSDGLHEGWRGVEFVGRKSAPAIEAAWLAAKHAPAKAKATALLAGLGLGVGGLYKADASKQKWVDKIPPSIGVNGAFDPSHAFENHRNDLNKITSGIGQLNTEMYPKTLRLKELKDAVAAGLPGSGGALQEIKQLEGEVADYRGKINAAQANLDRNINDRREYQEKIQSQFNTEAGRDNSVWTGLRRWLGHHRLPGGMDSEPGQNYYDDRMRRLQQENMRIRDEIDLAESAKRRTGNFYGGALPKAPEPQAPSLNAIL